MKYVVTIALVLIGMTSKAQVCTHAVIYCGVHKKWNVDSAQFARSDKAISGDGMQVKYTNDSTGTIRYKIQLNKRGEGRKPK